jgi:hypothetical protein
MLGAKQCAQRELVTPGSYTTLADSTFLQVLEARAYAPARRMVERVFEEWPTRRRAFVRDFRSHGFSARIWELALFGYFSESDSAIDMTEESPDFLISRDGLTVAVEATTTNPPRNEAGTLPHAIREAFPHIPDDVADSDAELIVQLAKALRRKVAARGPAKRHYWECSHVAGHPFVIAVEAFHGETSLYNGDSGLAGYLYGFRWTAERRLAGSIEVRAIPISEHSYGRTTIPSGFFFQPGVEHVSAVIFSNAATISQFQRIGIEVGFGIPDVIVTRSGTCFDPDPNSLKPALFNYEVKEGERRETFATGIRVLHNPNAVHPIPEGFFSGVLEMRLRSDGLVATNSPTFAPFNSATIILTSQEVQTEEGDS